MSAKIHLQLPPSRGQQTTADSISVVMSSDSLAPSLPSGAATSAKQDTGNTTLASILTAVATAAKQDTGNASLAAIDAGIPAALGQTTMSASMPVTIASNQSAIPASQSGTWTVQPGNTANTTPWLVTPTPAVSGGCTQFTLISAASTNLTIVKAGAGQLFGFNISNINAAVMYVTFYNTAGTPTLGTSVVRTVAVPASVACGATNYFNAHGIAFSSGIAIAISTAPTSGAVAAGDVIVNLDIK